MRNSAGTIVGDMLYKRLDAAGPAGGYIMQISCHADGTKLIAGDTLQPLWCNNTDKVWKQVLRASNKPSGFKARSTANESAGRRDQEGSTGAAIAPSDSSIWYLCQEAIILRCTGKGATVTMSPQTSYTSLGNSGDPRICGPYLDVHKTDAMRAMMGWNEGLTFTTDGFATDKPLVASVPACVADIPGRPRMVLVGFDPSNTAVAYAHSWGNGLYRSTNANTASPTFAKVSGFPLNVRRMRVAANGKVWATTAASGHNIWTYDGTNVVNITSDGNQGWHDIAIDPSNTNRVFVLDPNGYLQISTDGGTTWTGTWYANFPSPVGIYQNAVDIPYIGNYAGGFDVGAIMFDPSDTTKVYSTHGVGVSYTTFPSGFNRVDWYSQSAGIYQLIPYSSVSPVGYPALWSSMDRPIFRNNSGIDVAPSRYGPRASEADPSPSINHGWNLTLSPQDQSYVLNLTNYDPSSVGAAANLSGYSVDGGKTFTKFTNPPYTAFMGGGAMAVSANKDQILCFPGDNLPIRYTLDRGATAWQTMTLPGYPSGHSAGQFTRYLRRVIVCVDPVTPGTFLMYHPGINAGDGTVINSANAGWFRITGGLTNAPVRLTTGFAIPGTAGSAYECRLVDMPGVAGNFVFAGDSDQQNVPMIRTTDAGTTWSNVPVYNATSVSFGKAAPGSAYPTCWVIGVYNGVRGVHYSTDNLATFKTFSTIPVDEWSDWTYINADSNEFGLIYIAINGKGWVYGRLTDLKRLT